MNGWETVVAGHAALGFSATSALIPDLGPGSVAGFTVGLALAGLCVAMLDRRHDDWMRTPSGPGRSDRRQPGSPARGRGAALPPRPWQPARPVRGALGECPAALASAGPPPWRSEDSHPYPRRPGPGPGLPGLTGQVRAAPSAPRDDPDPSGASPPAHQDSCAAEVRPGRRRSRVRQRLDTLLADMLGDDTDEPAQPGGPARAGQPGAAGGPGGHEDPGPRRAPGSGAPRGEPDGSGRHGEPDEGFWGPDKPSRPYRSRHGLPGPVRQEGCPDGRRSAPRHAAPPAGFSARWPGRAARPAW